MNEDETPFARIPPPGIKDRPSPFVPEGEIAFYGAVAQGLRSKPRAVRLGVAIFVIAFFALPVIGFTAHFVMGSSAPTPRARLPALPPGAPVVAGDGRCIVGVDGRPTTPVTAPSTLSPPTAVPGVPCDIPLPPSPTPAAGPSG